MAKPLLTLTVGVSLVALLAVGVSASGSPDAATAARKKPRPVTLVLFGRDTVQTNVDNAPEGPSVGDERVITSPLFTKASGGNSVGRLDVHRVITSTDGAETTVVDQISETLSRGQIISAGSSTFSGPPGQAEGDKAKRSVVGGTGAYRLVRGELQTSLVGDSVTKLTHRFYPPRCEGKRSTCGPFSK